MRRNICLACAAAMFVLAASSLAMAQPGRGRGGGEGRRGGPDFGASGLLMNESVQKELELVDGQMEDLRAIGEEIGAEMRGMWSGMRDLSREERQEKMEEMRTKMREMRSKAEGRVNEVLLPNQLARLKQINLQNQIQSRGAAGALGNSEVADALGLTEDQKAKLQEKAQVVQRELQEKIEKLRKEAREDLMSVLTTEQREKLKELTGEQFEMSGGRGRGGAGGRQRGGERQGRRGERQGRPAAEAPTAE